MHRLSVLFVISTLSLLALAVIATPAMQAQTFTVIHNFTYGVDGGLPMAGVTMDAAGNLYGTTSYGGVGRNVGSGSGTVFRLKRSGSNWILTTLYIFAGGADGAHPYGRVAIAPDGTLYGTTTEGGSGGNGTIYRLRPSAKPPGSALAQWNETVLHRFTGSDGANPQGDLTFDQSGNIYGTTQEGGNAGGGVIYELAFAAGNWTETVLYNGGSPSGGVVFDRSGNLYAVFQSYSPLGSGAVYELSPAGLGWTEQILYGPGGEGWNPLGGLIMDPFGNLYGTVPGAGGEVFELTHASGWIFNELYEFGGSGEGPVDKLVMDSAGNLYGTTYQDGDYGEGGVFELALSNGTWHFLWLHSFSGNDGAYPFSNLVFDASGNLYGTTAFGGTYGGGVVFEITP